MGVVHSNRWSWVARHGPAVAVGDAVVVAAQQGEVGEVGGAVVVPVDDVVGVAPGGGGVAAGEDAAAVAGGEGSALGPVGVALFAAQVEGDAEVVDDEGVEAGVAGEVAVAAGEERFAVGGVERVGVVGVGTQDQGEVDGGAV